MGIISHFMSAPKQKLQNYVIRLIKPLARLLIKLDVPHKAFAELAKQSYVEAAYEHFALDKRKMTVSRVAVLTGLSRKEVQRIQQEGMGWEQPSVNRAARVVAGWLQDSDYLDGAHQPLVLKYKGSCSFESLVAKYSGDITSGAILDELLSHQIIEKVPNENGEFDVRLIKMGYILNSDEQSQAKLLLGAADNLLSSGVHNIQRDPELDEAHFQRQLTFHDVPDHLVPDFKQRIESAAGDILRQLQSDLSSELPESNIQDEPKQRNRVGLGLYYFHQNYVTTHNPNKEEQENDSF